MERPREVQRRASPQGNYVEQWYRIVEFSKMALVSKHKKISQ